MCLCDPPAAATSQGVQAGMLTARPVLSIEIINATHVQLPYEPPGALPPDGTEGECNSYIPSKVNGALSSHADYAMIQGRTPWTASSGS